MTQLRSLTLLIVEDCDADRELYRRLLKRYTDTDFQVLETCSKQEALDLYGQHKPDCLLIDYNLPGFTGIEFLETLIADNPNDSVAAVILTAGGNELLAARAIKAGARDYLPKDSINRDSLRLAIENSIDKAKNESLMKEKNESLECALEEAKLATTVKSEFLANMSHEIRTPLNGIVACLDLLADGKGLEEYADFIQLGKTSADHLVGLINDILDFSKIEAGQLELESITFSIEEALKQSINICKLQADAKDITVSMYTSDQVPNLVVGDIYHFKQIIINLLSNAIKFTPNGGGINLVAEVESMKDSRVFLHFGLSDTGIGIPEEMKAKIFEVFSQADSSTTRNYGGTGLGLSIASKLVEMMGGDIWVDSKVDIGSTFHFTVEMQLADEEILPGSKGGAFDSKSLDLDPLSILVAEDNTINQKLIRAILERKGHQVTIASDGEEACRFVESDERFDIVLMDVQMPVLDGVSATSRIRDWERVTGTRRLPVVALTANALAGDRERYLGQDMDGYVSKPIDQFDLFQTIKKLV